MGFPSPRKVWLFFFLILAAGLAASDNDLVLRTTVVPVGTRGATLTFPAGWGRQVLNADLGKDQFRRADAEEFLVLVEVPGFLVSEEALIQTLETREAAIRAENPQAVSLPLAPLATAHPLFVRHRMDLRLNSLDLSYVLGSVSIPGARYFLMAWARTKNFPNLLRDVDSIVSSLRGDPESPEYGQRTKTVPVSATGTEAAVVLRYPGGEYSPRKASSPDLLALYGREEDLSVAVQEKAWSETGEGFALTVSTGGKPRTYPTQFWVAESKGAENRLEVQLTPPAPQGLVLRIEGSYGREGLTAAARDLLVGLTVEPGHFQQALPPVAPEGGAESRAELLSLASASVREGVVPEEILDFFWSSDRSPWFLTSQGVGTLNQGAWQSRGRWDGKALRGPVASGTVTFYVAHRGQGVLAFLGSGFQSQAWTAEDLVAGHGQAGVGVLRSSGRPGWDLPFGRGPGEVQTLWLRAPDGSEASLGSFPPVRQAAFDGAGTQILLETEPLDPQIGGPGGPSLVRLVPGGAPVPVGRWASIEALVPADGGWLVQGAPVGRPMGTWFLGTEGPPRSLLGNLGLTPLGLKDGRFWFTFPRRWEAKGSDWKARSVYSVNLAEVRLPGPRAPGYSAGAFNRAGAAAGLETHYPPLPTQQSALALVRSVRLALSTETGLPWPEDPRFFDTLPEVTDLREGLDPAGFRALTLLLAGSFLDSGAEWVDSQNPSEGFQPPSQDGDSAYARSLFLPELVFSTLYEDEGWYEPVTTVLGDRKGQALLVGLDPTSLARRQAETLDPALEGLLGAPDKAPLGRWLLEPTRVANQGLVGLVLQRLWRQGDQRGLSTVLEILGPRSGAMGELMRPLVLWQARDFVLEGPEDFQALFGADPEAMIDDLKTLVTETRHEPMAVYFLGKAWEFSAFPYGRFNARQCYQTLEGNYQVSEALKDRVALDLARLADAPTGGSGD